MKTLRSAVFPVECNSTENQPSTFHDYPHQQPFESFSINNQESTIKNSRRFIRYID